MRKMVVSRVAVHDLPTDISQVVFLIGRSHDDAPVITLQAGILFTIH